MKAHRRFKYGRTLSSRSVVVVDAFSSGRLLVPAIRARGYDCIHVQSMKSPDAFFAESLDRTQVPETLYFSSECVDELVATLKLRRVECVLPGCELGVEVADLLAQRLGLRRRNSIRRTRARRDKRKMHTYARRAGLRVPRQVCVSGLRGALSWKRSLRLERVVVKPVDSLGSDGVSVCDTEADVAAALAPILGCRNRAGRINERALVQEYLSGDEYAVNSVSVSGEHFVLLVWRYRKRTTSNGRVLYDHDSLVSESDAAARKLAPFVYRLLDALQIRYGPAHSEIVIDERGPVLIELGARMDGVVSPEQDQRCLGHSQVELTLDSYLNPNGARLQLKNGYRLLQPGRIVHLIARKGGVVQAAPGLHYVQEQCASYLDAKVANPGTTISVTRDLLTSPGHVLLAHPNLETVERDYDEIRRRESSEFFVLKGRAPS